MATYTLDQAVNPGNLILAFNRKKRAHMLLVKLTLDSNNAHPSAASIIVDEVGMSIPENTGAWMTYGPDVYYIEADEGSKPKAPLSTEMALGDFLFPLSSIDREESGGNGFRDVRVLVNPHGRDVLKHYFRYNCPECYGSGWICPGCGGVSSRWPEVFGSCGVDQSCPVCMSYDFALNDKCILKALKDFERYPWRYKRGDPYLSTETYQSLFEEALSLHRGRYELINLRRKEMGLGPYSADELRSMEEDLKESWFK